MTRSASLNEAIFRAVTMTPLKQAVLKIRTELLEFMKTKFNDAIQDSTTIEQKKMLKELWRSITDENFGP